MDHSTNAQSAVIPTKVTTTAGPPATSWTRCPGSNVKARHDSATPIQAAG